MRQVELLAPAGSMEALIAAVQNGCDAVYLGGTMFGARAYANNFDENEMIQALQYAHSYGVKVYVTMNTLLFEQEMESACSYAQFLYEHGVDALIIQDLGLFDLLHQRFPDLELHASTQMHIHNEAGISMMRDAGMKRVVLPRETSIDEIRRYAKLGVDLEVFVQGALCVSYSGQCLMSTKKLARSGNRGACAQMCRMKYQLVQLDHDQIKEVKQPGEYLLSPKDINTLHRVGELIEAGITSFKIEGRMKRPEYVAVMVSLYRKAIDAYLHQTVFDEAEAEIMMRKIFNRGFSEGYLFTQGGRVMMNPYRPNHMGITIGTVIRKRGKRVSIQLSAPLHQHDGIRFLCEQEDIGCKVNKLYVNDRLVNEAQAKQIVEIEIDGWIPKGTEVLKTSDAVQLKAIHETYEKATRKVDVTMRFQLHKGKTAKLCVWDDLGNQCELFSRELVEKAIKTPLSEARIQEQLSKCGDTIFRVTKIDCDVQPDAILSIKELNAMRRNVLTQLYEKRIACPLPKRMGEYHRSFSVQAIRGILVSVRTTEQYLAARQAGITQIYAESSLYRTLCDTDTSIGYSGKRVMKESYPSTSILFCENSGMMMPNAIAEHFVNVTNSYAAAFLFAHGVKGIVLSSECDKSQRTQLIDAFSKRYGTAGSFISYGYGREELMVMEYCPINTVLSDQGKTNCHRCKGNTTYALEDLHHHRYPLYGDEDCRMHVMDESPSETWEPSEAILLRFFDETQEQCVTLIETAKMYLI